MSGKTYADLEVDHVESGVTLPGGKSAWSGGPDGHEVFA